MTSRARAAALDDTSMSAAAQQTPDRVSEVQVVILDIYRVAGPLTDDALEAVYEHRAENFPGVPKVSPQSIRTRRSELVHRGAVRSMPQRGFSRYGNPCAVWGLAEQVAR